MMWLCQVQFRGSTVYSAEMVQSVEHSRTNFSGWDAPNEIVKTWSTRLIEMWAASAENNGGVR